MLLMFVVRKLTIDILILQMFTAITKLVLKTKKEQQLRIQQQQTNDSVRLRSSSHGNRRKKCCWCVPVAVSLCCWVVRCDCCCRRLEWALLTNNTKHAFRHCKFRRIFFFTFWYYKVVVSNFNLHFDFILAANIGHNDCLVLSLHDISAVTVFSRRQLHFNEIRQLSWECSVKLCIVWNQYIERLSCARRLQWKIREYCAQRWSLPWKLGKFRVFKIIKESQRTW